MFNKFKTTASYHKSNKNVRVALLLALFFICIFNGAQCLGTEPAGSTEALWNEIAIARIAATPATDTLMFFFCSDLHIPFDDRGIVSKIANDANKRMPSFVLTGGDNVQVGNPANFSAYKRAIGRFKVPVVAAIGNHDTAFDDYKNEIEWKKRFGSTFFYFDSGPARFIFLNNADFELTEDQFVFLESALKTELRKFIIMHRPPNYLNALYTTPMGKSSERFRRMVESARVTAVLMGHEHHFGAYDIGGVKYIVSGGAGGKLNTTTDNNFHHFIIGHVSPSGFEYEIVKF
jgi:3',5'-cyclic-AMP phosphodiesterase